MQIWLYMVKWPYLARIRSLVNFLYLMSYGRYALDLSAIDPKKIDGNELKRLSREFPERTARSTVLRLGHLRTDELKDPTGIVDRSPTSALTDSFLPTGSFPGFCMRHCIFSSKTLEFENTIL